ncbi:MAG: DUF6677 family protein [Vicinamibacterales bacterium]
MATKSSTADRARGSADRGALVLLCAAAWLVPGVGHLWQGRRQKGMVFLFAVPVMFVLGLALHGTIFPFQFAEPLSGLAAIAESGTGLPWIFARMTESGAGLVTSTTWEYGNTFMIVAGLLNALIVLDAFDIAMGRK